MQVRKQQLELDMENVDTYGRKLTGFGAFGGNVSYIDQTPRID